MQNKEHRVKREWERERDVGIICVITYDDLALEAWTPRRERDREYVWICILHESVRHSSMFWLVWVKCLLRDAEGHFAWKNSNTFHLYTYWNSDWKVCVSWISKHSKGIYNSSASLAASSAASEENSTGVLRLLFCCFYAWLLVLVRVPHE